MFKEIEMGAKKVSFLSNGVTPLWYKQVFHTDLLQTLTNGEDMEIAADKIPELAFIMSKQAERADMMQLDKVAYFEWLETFEPLDLVVHGSEIANVYISDSLPSVEPKKKGKGKQSA